jgi:hypothetical protein
MRKIEVQMNAAISAGKEFRSANTDVVQADGISVVLLHGNKIAEIGEGFIRLFDGGHQSKTTKSRLNAILSAHGLTGECVFQKGFNWFVNLNNGKSIITVPFFSSMRLN